MHLYIGVSCILFAVSSSRVALGANLRFDVTVKSEKIGEFNFFTVDNNTGLNGEFNVNKNNWSIAQLASYLGVHHLNWFQIVLNNSSPNYQFPATFIDAQKGGQGKLWADQIPWYLDETPPPEPILTIGNETYIALAESFTDLNQNQQWDLNEPFIDSNTNRKWDPAKTTPPTFIPPNNQSLLAYSTQGSKLIFRDYPVGANFDFATFLIGDFGNKTYDVLGGFLWSTKVENNITQITSLKAGATFTQGYANKIRLDFGYNKVLKLPTYTFNNSLSPGEVDTFQIPGLAPNTPFMAWIDNLPGINPPGKPDTLLGLFHQNGYLTNYNDNGGSRGTNLASGLKESVKNTNGSINLKVTGKGDFNFDGKLDYSNNPHCQTGNYNLHVKPYDENFPTGGITGLSSQCPPPPPPVCTGGSGGGGCITNRSLQTAYRVMSLFDTDSEDNSEDNSESFTKVPEPTPALGLLALGVWGVFQGLKMRKIK